MEPGGYECQGCGATSESPLDAEKRYCVICGRCEAEVMQQRKRQVMLAEVLERHAQQKAA